MKHKKGFVLCVVCVGCFCLIALVGIGVWRSGMLTTPPVTLDNDSSISGNHGDQSTLPVQNDTIVWNENYITSFASARLAGHFETVSKEQWLSVYPIELPNNMEWEYSLVYKITKDNGVTDTVMCGHISGKDNTDGWISIFVGKESGPATSFLFECYEVPLKESTINNKSVFLGAKGSTRYAALEINDWDCYIEIHDMSETVSLQLLKDMIGINPYDAFRDPNVLWGSEEAFHWEFEYPPGSVVVSSGLTDLMSGANVTNMVAFTVELMHMCEFHPVDMNSLLIPDSLVDDGYLLECIQLFNKADNLDRCTELYNEARMYVEGTISTEEYLSYYYSWKTSDAKWVRSRFIEFGFIPVYDEEFTEQGQESINRLLTFVGAPQDIQFLEEKITVNEIYLLRLPKITYHNPLIAIKE